MAFLPNVALDYLRRAHASGRLGHAYLIVGGDEAFSLAKRVAALVVRAETGDIAGHLDVHIVEPESKSRRILIDQMRELEGALQLRASATGGRKVGIVRDADRMMAQASNAFLKTLEEPPAESLLLLVSALPESLPETILSRCIKVMLRADQTSAQTVLPEEEKLHQLLARFARERPISGGASVAAGYLFLREFTQLLSSARSRAQAEGENAYKSEESQYAKTTDGKWLEDREDYHKGATEAHYLADRARLIDTVANWWRDVLRHQTAFTDNRPLSDGDAHETKSFAGRLTTPDVLRRLSRIEELRENMDRNIQEALALEVAFVQVFGS